jgi:hypothetical protein
MSVGREVLDLMGSLQADLEAKQLIELVDREAA